MKIKTSYLILNTDSPVTEGANKFRGYIANQFPEHLILHHHLEGTQFLYTYPKVQYKVIGGTPSILGIDEGADVVKNISNHLDTISLGKNSYRVKQKVLYEQESDVKPDRIRHYKFITPWIGLNSKNYQLFNQEREWQKKKLLLNKTLVGNILSMCKGLGIIANRHLEVHSHFDSKRVIFKGLEVMGFAGEFKVNFRIPDFFGLGKGVSQGFGTVKEAKNVDTGDI